MTAQKTAQILGVLGLIPFVIPASLIWLVDPDVANMLETMQFAYAGLIISFMGGVQWGYAVKQGEDAKPYQIMISVIPTLVIFTILSFVLILKPLHMSVIMVGLLIVQAIVDHRIISEKWFVKLRWVLTLVASLSMAIVAIVQGFY